MPPPPPARFLVTTAYAGHAPSHFWPNLVAMGLVVVAKSPIMHKVRYWLFFIFIYSGALWLRRWLTGALSAARPLTRHPCV